ncbi:unnamed protein product [Leuciscus chuanchicus]
MRERILLSLVQEAKVQSLPSPIRSLLINSSTTMDDIDTLIKKSLPAYSTLQPILAVLQNLAVETVDDMKFVQKDALAGVLKPIQVRKLLAHKQGLLSFKPLKHGGIFPSLTPNYCNTTSGQYKPKLKPTCYFTRNIFNTDLLCL